MSKGKNAKKRPRVQIKGVIDGSVLVSEPVTKQIPFLIFLTILAALYITNRYHAETLYKKIDNAKKELKELRSESIATASELLNRSKESQVAAEVKRRGMELDASDVPPFVIVNE